MPGHGTVCGPEIIDTVAGYLRFVQDVARRGREPTSARSTPPDRATSAGYAELLDSERLVGNLHRAYAA